MEGYRVHQDAIYALSYKRPLNILYKSSIYNSTQLYIILYGVLLKCWDTLITKLFRSITFRRTLVCPLLKNKAASVRKKWSYGKWLLFSNKRPCIIVLIMIYRPMDNSNYSIHFYSCLLNNRYDVKECHNRAHAW